MTQLSSKRTRAIVLGALVVVALVLAGIASGPWWRLSVETKQATFSGTESTGGLALLLALASGAGVLLLLALGGRGKQVMGVVLGLLGVAMATLGIATPKPGQLMIDARLQTMSLSVDWTLDRTALPLLYALAALLFLAAAAVLIIAAPRWQDRSARYRRAAPFAGDDPEGWWRDLDAGLDPTGDPAREPIRESNRDSSRNVADADPDFHNGDSTGNNDGAYRGGQR